jgi:hypothetical protein
MPEVVARPASSPDSCHGLRYATSPTPRAAQADGERNDWRRVARSARRAALRDACRRTRFFRCWALLSDLTWHPLERRRSFSHALERARRAAERFPLRDDRAIAAAAKRSGLVQRR